MKRSKAQIIDGFLWLKKYFGEKENPLFKPEFEASTKVISIIQNKELSKESLHLIIKVFNQVTE